MEQLSPSLEDYMEAIYVVKINRKSVKPIEIARKLNVKKPSVTGAVKKLSRKGFLRYRKYEDIVITEKGEKLARDIYRKHKLLSKFFIEVLQIKEDTAEEDACRMEHALSKPTLSKLTKFIEMSEIATRNLPASARSKRAISEHTQEHAPRFSAAVLDRSVK